MSFILDALKKSEAERQQNGSTEFTGVPTRNAPTGVPRWLWVVGVLLIINLAVLIGLLLREDAPPVQLPTTHLIDSEKDAPISFQDQVAAAQQNMPPQQSMLKSENTGAAQIVSAETAPSEFGSPNVITQNPASIRTEDIYPTIHEVRARGNGDIPELHLDIHVFSVEPQGRFVFINMAKHREGDVLNANIRLKEITPDGVLLDHAGQVFLLPRE